MKEFNQKIEITKNPNILFQLVNEFDKSFEILNNNIKNRYLNIQRLVNKIV